MAGVHSKRSPSTASRWLSCPGSVALCDSLPAQGATSAFAAEGTVFHKIVRDALRLGFAPEGMLGKIVEADGHKIEVSEEMVDHAIEAIELANNLGRGKLHIEARVSLDKWTPGESGTVDVGHVGNEFISILDWKYGAGVSVSPVRNAQAMSYGLGFWNDIARYETTATKFRFIIHQPRIPSGGGEWECDLDTLLKFGKELARGWDRTNDPKAPLVAGEAQCKFCPAKNNCPEYDRFTLAAMQLKFEDLSGPDKPKLDRQMTPERMAYIVMHGPMIRTWLDQIDAQVLDDYLKGKPTPGLKAVYGRNPPRKWGEKELAEKFLVNVLQEAAWKQKLISPTDCDKLLSAAELAVISEYIDYGSPKPMLVPVEDKREGIRNLAEKFDDVSLNRRKK